MRIGTRLGALLLCFLAALPALGATRADQLAQIAATVDRTAAEQAAGLVAGTTPGTICNYGYRPGNVLRYCADKTGATDSTAAWNAALAQRVQHGDRIVFPAGLYKGNFVVTGQYIDVQFEHFAYEDAGTVYGFIANNAANPIWSIGDGTTLTTSVRLVGGLQMHGQSSAQKCLLFNGAANVWIDGLVVRGCTTYGVNYTASTTRSTSYVFINDYRIDIPSGAATAIGLVMTQPGNYPTSFATALYLSNGAIQGQTTAGSWGVQINANCTLWVQSSYWTMGNGTGIDFPDAGGTGTIQASGLFVDTLGTSNDTLVTIVAAQPIQTNMFGLLGVNGKVSIAGTSSSVALGFPQALSYRTMMFDPSVTGFIDFQDGSLGAQDQTARANQAMQIFRSGTNWFFNNTVGATVMRGSRLQLQNAAGNGDGMVYFSSSAVQIFTGTGAPAASVPNGSIYLQTDAGVASPLWVRMNGAWSQVTIP